MGICPEKGIVSTGCMSHSGVTGKARNNCEVVTDNAGSVSDILYENKQEKTKNIYAVPRCKDYL